MSKSQRMSTLSQAGRAPAECSWSGLKEHWAEGMDRKAESRSSPRRDVAQNHPSQKGEWGRTAQPTAPVSALRLTGRPGKPGGEARLKESGGRWGAVWETVAKRVWAIFCTDNVGAAGRRSAEKSYSWQVVPEKELAEGPDSQGTAGVSGRRKPRTRAPRGLRQEDWDKGDGCDSGHSQSQPDDTWGQPPWSCDVSPLPLGKGRRMPAATPK